jgi:hypothetical protein
MLDNAKNGSSRAGFIGIPHLNLIDAVNRFICRGPETGVDDAAWVVAPPRCE